MQQLDISEYTQVLKEHKKQIIIVFLCVFIPLVFISFEIISEYESGATLYIEKVPLRTEEIIFRRGSSRIDMTKEIIRLQSMDFTRDIVRALPEKTFFSILNQLSLKERVFQRLKNTIGEKAYFSFKKVLGKPADGRNEEALERHVVDIVENSIAIKYRGEGIITIKATTNNPETSYDIVNTYIKLWQGINLQENKEDVMTARQFVEEELNKASEKLTSAEENYLSYKKYLGIPMNIEQWEIEKIDPELARLASEVQSSRESYNSWYNKYREILVWEKLVKSDIVVVDSAEIAQLPSGASKMRVRLIGFLFALVFSLGLPILIDFLKDYVKKPIDIENLLNVPVLAVIPHMKW